MWRYQHVSRNLIETDQKVSILPLQTWAVLFEPIKTDNKMINNKETLDIRNNRSHSFTTPLGENSDSSPSSKSLQFWFNSPSSVVQWISIITELQRIPPPKKQCYGIAHIIR